MERDVLISGINSQYHVYHAFDNTSRTYFCKDNTWHEDATNGHWHSIVELLRALKESAITDAKIDLRYF